MRSATHTGRASKIDRVSTGARQARLPHAALVSVVQVRLEVGRAVDAAALTDAVAVCNEAATFASRRAWESRTFHKFALQKTWYGSLRQAFPGLGAQAAVRVFARVAQAYANRRASKKRAHIFRPQGAVPFDARMLSFNRAERRVSVWTPRGRVTLSYTGRFEDLDAIDTLPVGECDLFQRGGRWLLQVSVTLPEPEQRAVKAFLGVDQGIANLAVTSGGAVLPSRALPGTITSNGHVRNLRERRYRQRRRLQCKNTSSARRVARRLSGRESRMMKDVNHQISKYVVREAERTGRGLALEELQGIRGRVRAHRSQRRTLHSWAFGQLIEQCQYKTRRAGIPLVMVDPAYTSQTCPLSLGGCGHTSRRNRPARGRFVCENCGLAGHADTFAAANVAERGEGSWALVNGPHATGDPAASRNTRANPPTTAAKVRRSTGNYLLSAAMRHRVDKPDPSGPGS
ncbi:RNA-guided endonuclease InsQ/TnpB family protein [Streptomyces lutosisoli]|uniref:RNA-guided endonuclease InsQ/TnpB family protein n=1 Tax=Streptomyces lutosisoli TaxID=2665721 RepID=A0ABW2VLB1_9ACTN